jgi:uncharacterized protein (DUF342 family)
LANPLKRFVPLEERSDGVYIKVTREAAPALNIDEMVNSCRSAMVINFDARLIGEVVNHCHGIFEKIGPPFDYYNPKIEQYVDMTITPMKAVMKLSSMCLTDNIKPTSGALLYCLNIKGVRYGIKPEIIGGVLREALFDKEVAVAEGQSPVAGADAIIRMEVDIDHSFKPLENKNGTVDYRNINTITQIKNGQTIAKKIPATKGRPGRAVSGDEIPASPGKDTRFTGGKNTHVSDDGLFLLASKNGFIYKDGELIHVGDLLPIGKDVDFSVGNIKYTGDIQIKGNVLPGFTVETEGNIAIMGQVEASRIISRNGAVLIQKGIIGKGETYVSGKTGITAEFVQEAALVCDGIVTVNKFCLNSDVTCGAFEAKDPHSSVLGGQIKVFAHIDIFQVGNDKGIVTKLSLVDKYEAANKEKLKDLETLLKKLNDALELVKKQLKAKSAILKMAGETSGRMTEELKKWLATYNDQTMKIKFVEKNIAEIKEKLKNPETCDGYIKVAGNIHPGTELSFFGISKVIKTLMTNKMFHFKSGSIGVEG